MVRRYLVATCILLMVATGVGLAATTGRMSGTVLDNEAIALPGVTVTITSDKLIGGPQVAITGVNGGFVFNLLPVGMYRVQANMPGFQPAGADLRVALGRVANVTFNMVPEQFGGEIEVVATVPVVDTAQVNTSVVFDQDYLQQAAIGSGGRDYLSIISQAAGVAGGGNASVYGGTSGDNSYLVDGLNTTDPLLGTFGTNFNYDAIQEISFQTGGFEAEFGQATGGIINLVTKSGGNEFSGSLDIRYRDEGFIESGEHFDKDDQTSSLENISVTLGGPIMRDKLWFFLSGENVDSKSQNTGANVVRNYVGSNYIAKATWQASDSHRLVAKYSGDPADISGANSSRFVEASADRTQKQGGVIGQFELNSVLSESILLNAQAGLSYGFIESAPSHGNINASLHTNEDSFIDTDSTAFSSADDRDREEYRVNMTIFVDDFAGAHEFKAGIEYNDLFYGGTGFINGGGYFYDITEPTPGLYQDINGDGHFTHYVTIKEIEGFDLPNGIYDFQATQDEYITSKGNITTLFLQDAWRPFPSLTLKPGARVDTVVMDNHVGDQVSDMTRFQPRLGFAWDVMGDAKQVIRGSWGRFMDPTALSIPNFATGVTEQYNEYNTLEFYCNRIGICDRNTLDTILGTESFEWTNAEGHTYTLFDNRSAAQVFEPAQTVDQIGVGTLDAPFAEEFLLAYEIQIAPETSLEFTYINKTTKEIIEDSCSGNSWIWGEVPLPSLDDSDTWTNLSTGCDFFVIGNMPLFYRDYEGAIFKFETRGENFHLIASYTWSESFGNTANGARQSYATALGDVYAIDFFNREGWMPDHRSNRIKISGYYNMPYDITFGFDGFFSGEGRLTPNSTCGNFIAASDQDILDLGGNPEDSQFCSTADGIFLGNSTIFIDSRGAIKTKSVWQMDVQFSKSFQIGSMDLTGILSVQNLFDREMDATFNSTAFRSDFEVGEVTSYWDPRRYELGFRLEF